MAKRRKRKSSSKCPEPFNTLIDIAGGIAMGAVASHMEKKYNYTKKGKINPYAVSAAGIASGRMKSTEDIIRTGAILGAMGSFDVEADDPMPQRNYVQEDPVFREIREAKVNNNRYAWRLNCEDGTEFGVYPHDYETREEYNAAIRAAKDIVESDETREATIESGAETRPPENEFYLYVRVSRLDNGLNQYYLTHEENIRVGDMVSVPTEHGDASGIVIGVARYSMSDAPQPVHSTPYLIKKI